MVKAVSLEARTLELESIYFNPTLDILSTPGTNWAAQLIMRVIRALTGSERTHLAFKVEPIAHAY